MLTPPKIFEPQDIVLAGGVDEVVWVIEVVVVAVADVVFVDVIVDDVGEFWDNVDVEVSGSDVVDDKVDTAGIYVENRVVEDALCCIEELVVDDVDVKGPVVRVVDETAAQIRPIFDEPRSTVSTKSEQSK